MTVLSDLVDSVHKILVKFSSISPSVSYIFLLILLCQYSVCRTSLSVIEFWLIHLVLLCILRAVELNLSSFSDVSFLFFLPLILLFFMFITINSFQRDWDFLSILLECFDKKITGLMYYMLQLINKEEEEY